MNSIDVFNGDADGICALVQLRRSNPLDALLITGVKRDISLLSRIGNDIGKNAQITVLDISFEKNVNDVDRLLEYGAHLVYYDHHQTGKIIKHQDLNLNISLNANTCTSLIVDNQLNGKYHAWALVGAFGDNLNTTANSLGDVAGYSINEIKLLKQLGQLVNYNAYGEDVSDLFFHPEKLFSTMRHYDDPITFMSNHGDIIDTLDTGYKNDFALARAIAPIFNTEAVSIYELPNKKWARRISGVWGNHLANSQPNKAHAVIRKNNANDYQVSIRAPLVNKHGADIVASKFQTGGGRKAAAGINALPENKLVKLIQSLQDYYRPLIKP